MLLNFVVYENLYDPASKAIKRQDITFVTSIVPPHAVHLDSNQKISILEDKNERCSLCLVTVNEKCVDLE